MGKNDAPNLALEQDAYLRAARVGRLAMLRPDGYPQSLPVCYAWDGRRIYSVVDEKPKRVELGRLQRLMNIAGHAQVSLLVDTYQEDWSRIGYVLVYGRAEALTAGADYQAGLAALREKYPQYHGMDLEGRPLICIIPERVTGWGVLAPEHG